jgi:hypothetical protein
MRSWRWLGAMAVVLAVGCDSGAGGGDGNVSQGACDTRPMNSTCTDYSGPAEVVSSYENICPNLPGTWLPAGCPATDRVGGCRQVNETLDLTYTWWGYSPGLAAEYIQQGCTTGTFLPP